VTSKQPMRLLLLNGPNLNMLGVREPKVYGSATLPEIEAELRERAALCGAELLAFQSNSEGELVTRVQEARGQADGIIINPGAYTHTSIALRDALAASGLPAVEVHLTNLYQRESFRRRSYTAGACLGVVMGFGKRSYVLALDALMAHLQASKGEASLEEGNTRGTEAE